VVTVKCDRCGAELGRGDQVLGLELVFTRTGELVRYQLCQADFARFLLWINHRVGHEQKVKGQ